MGKLRRLGPRRPNTRPAGPKAKKAKVEAKASKKRVTIDETPPALSSEEEESDGPSDYERLLATLQHEVKTKGHSQKTSRSKRSREEGTGEGSEGKDGEEGGGEEGVGLPTASADGEGSSEYEDDSVVETTGTGQNQLPVKLASTEDSFVVHFEQDLGEDEIEELERVFSEPLQYRHSVDPVLHGVSEAECLPTRTPEALDVKGKTFSELHVKKQLSDLWSGPSSTAKFTPLQEKLYAIMGSYKDLMFARRTFQNGEEIRELYLLHALNHILKTRSRILKNNARLTQAAKEEREIEEPRDQGLTRPKVLILVPFREAALRTVNMLIQLFLPKGQGQVNNRKRFMDEYSEEEHIKSKIEKPASHEAMFAGNIDDCFRMGVAVKRNTINLYAKFYSADLIIASPLGLRTIIGAEGDKKRDYDFLSSLELVILDQADVYMMQNWEHVLHLLDHTHLQPRESHDVDFSRVRMWCINGWSKFYRQTLLFSDFETPEINSIFSSKCRNYAGRVKVCETEHVGTISRVTVQVPHVFRRYPCSVHTDLPEARFKFFVSKILPDFTGDLMKRTCIVVHSYFDFVRLRGHLTRQEAEFEQLCEYTEAGDISRARTRFFHGEAHFLLYTERAHFFRRFRIRGIRHLIFYSLPTYSEFYPELANFLEERAGREGVTCTVLYSQHFDSLALCRIVGNRQAYVMTNSADDTYTLMTGE